ncbi:PHP domain-containing protein [Proteiniclasticum sp. C24MP]|uniref:PHP domain-containing protein n=1 Tax=Proteiniclasticum sp. C24MP TaxID=3374101 RepID=UPI0037540CB7
MSYIDLHMHSNYSADGEFSPRRLMEMCHRKNLKVVALSDHNSIKGIPEAIRIAKGYGIHVIPAIELDCTYDEVNLHVLGYGIHEDPRYDAYEEDLERQERASADQRLALLEKLGIIFSRERIRELSGGGIVTGEILAEAAMELPENRNHPLMIPYFEGGERSDNPYVNFYWDLCAKGKPAYVPIIYMTLVEAIALIMDTGGVPVLAHLGQNIGLDAALLDGILSQGIPGIEVYSSYHDENTTAHYLKEVRRRGLFFTAGSDFHGKTKPAIALGGHGSRDQEEEILQGLTSHLE